MPLVDTLPLHSRLGKFVVLILIKQIRVLKQVRTGQVTVTGSQSTDGSMWNRTLRLCTFILTSSQQKIKTRNLLVVD